MFHVKHLCLPFAGKGFTLARVVYQNECAWRFNNRKNPEMFDRLIAGC